jgi:hypothetical protein
MGSSSTIYRSRFGRVHGGTWYLPLPPSLLATLRFDTSRCAALAGGYVKSTDVTTNGKTSQHTRSVWLALY